MLWLACLAAAPAALLLALFAYNRLSTRQCRCTADLDGKTVVVTGANTGIGYETARELALRGARVVLGCRSEERARHAVERLASETRCTNIDWLPLDTSSPDSVRAFVERLLPLAEGRVHVLVNNAGASAPTDGRRLTADGHELTWATNYLGHYLLTRLLLRELFQFTLRGLNLKSLIKGNAAGMRALSRHQSDVGGAAAGAHRLGRRAGPSQQCMVTQPRVLQLQEGHAALLRRAGATPEEHRCERMRGTSRSGEHACFPRPNARGTTLVRLAVYFVRNQERARGLPDYRARSVGAGPMQRLVPVRMPRSVACHSLPRGREGRRSPVDNQRAVLPNVAASAVLIQCRCTHSLSGKSYAVGPFLCTSVYNSVLKE